MIEEFFSPPSIASCFLVRVKSIYIPSVVIAAVYGLHGPKETASFILGVRVRLAKSPSDFLLRCIDVELFVGSRPLGLE